MSETAPHENPLIPNKKLRQLFVAMVEMRVLDEHIAGLQRGVKARRRLESTRGEEACRVSMAIELAAGDLVSDAQVGVAMGLLAGDKVGALLRRVATGKLQRQIAERTGLVIDLRTFGGEGFDERAVTVGGNAEAFDAVVPFGVLHPGPAARRRMQQQCTAII